MRHILCSMAQGSTVWSTLRTLHLENRGLFALVAVWYLLALASGNSSLAVTAMIVLVSWGLVLFAQQHSAFESLLLLVFGTLIFAFLIQLAGEVLGSWVTSSLVSGLVLVLVLWAFVARPGGSERISSRSLVQLGLIVIPALGLTYWATNMGSASRITILGYGYDNAAHLMQARSILASGGSLLLANDPSIGPTFLQDNSQLSGSVIAAFTRLAGIDETAVFGLTSVFFLVTLALPLLAVVGIWSATAGSKLSIVGRICLASGALVLVLGSYLSRIWFSGYFASNIATLCLLLLGLYVTQGKTARPFVIGVLIILTGHAYSLFLVLALLVGLPTLLVHGRSLLRNGIKRAPLRSTFSYGILLGLAASLLLPYFATRRSYSSSQFLVDGGIEPFPKIALSVSLLVFLFPILLGSVRRESIPSLTSAGLLVSASLLVASYSINQKGYIAYYPAKMIIASAVCIVAIFVALFRLSDESSLVRHLPLGALVALLASGGVRDNGRIFTSAYMGRLSSVWEEIADPNPLVVDGVQILRFMEVGNELAKPLLLMPSAEFAGVSSRPIHVVPSGLQSELSTRWVNTLTGQWTDSTWRSWMAVQGALWNDSIIDQEIRASGVTVITDSDDIVKYARELGLNGCLVDELERCS